MQAVNAKAARYNFGQPIDMARTEHVSVVNYRRPVVVVLAVEEHERLKALEPAAPTKLKQD